MGWSGLTMRPVVGPTTQRGPQEASLGSSGVRGPAQTAVVVDRWPLVRLGLVGVLNAGGVEVIGQAAKVSEALLLVRMGGVDLVVFGSPLDGLSPAAIRSARMGDNPPKIVVLVPPSGAGADDISTLFVAGADALLVVSIGPDDLAEALARVGRGERVVGPELGPSVARQGSLDEPSYLDNGGGALTAKELEVLALLAQGHSNKQIARALYVSDATVKTHLQHIYAKFEVQSRFGALSRAAEMGLLK